MRGRGRLLHDPDCAVILIGLDDSGALVPCDCGDRQKARMRNGKARRSHGGGYLLDGCEAIGDGNYRKRLVRSPGD
jgi:hypothetical protein